MLIGFTAEEANSALTSIADSYTQSKRGVKNAGQLARREQEADQAPHRVFVAGLPRERPNDEPADDRLPEFGDGRILRQLTVAHPDPQALGELELEPEAEREVVADLGILGGRGDQRAQQRLAVVRHEDARDAHDPLLDIGDEIAGVRGREVDGEESAIGQALGDECALRPPPPVDGLLADAGFLGDAFDRELVVAQLLEHLRGRGQDGFTRCGTADRSRSMLVHGSRLTPREQTRRCV